MTGRESHTRQGCARGQRHGTLDREDPDLWGEGTAPWAWGGLGAEAERGVLRHAPAVTLRTLAGVGPGCWCGEGPVGHHGEGRHPNPRRDVIEAAIEEHNRRVEALLEGAAVAASRLGVGVLVAARRGQPWRCGPHASVPPGEVHWRASDALSPDDEALFGLTLGLR